VIGDRPFGLDTEITVELKDGTVRKKYNNTWQAETNLPLQRKRLEKKFLSVTKHLMSEENQHQFIALNRSLEKVQSLHEVMNLISSELVTV